VNEENECNEEYIKSDGKNFEEIDHS